MSTPLSSEMLNETKKARFAPAVPLQVLLFIAVFTVAQTLQSFILLPPLLIEMRRMDIVNRLVSRLETPTGLTETFDWVMEGVSEILSSQTVWVAMLFSTLLVIVTVVGYCRLIEKRSLRSMGITKKSALPDYGVGVLLGLFLSSAAYGVLFLLGRIEQVSFGRVGPMLFVFLVGFLIQSASEELLMRGYFMNSVAARSNWIVSVLLNSAIFMVLHVFNPGVTLLSLVNILQFGLIFSLLTLLTDRIWMACGMHFSWNFAIACLYGGNVSGMESAALINLSIKGGDRFGLEGDIITTLLATVMIGVLLLLLWRKKARQELTVTAPSAAV